MGVLRLAKTFGPERLDAACERALHINSYTYQSLHSILKNGLDRQRRKPTTDGPAISVVPDTSIEERTENVDTPNP